MTHRPDEEMRAALDAYWGARTPAAGATAYARLRALGLRPAFGEELTPREKMIDEAVRAVFDFDPWMREMLAKNLGAPDRVFVNNVRVRFGWRAAPAGKSAIMPDVTVQIPMPAGAAVPKSQRAA